MPAHARSNRTPDGAKKRWSADDRARRSGSPVRGRTQRADDTGGRAARRTAEFGQSDGGARDRRPDWFPGGRTAEEGQRGGDRPTRGRDDRPSRGADDRGDRPFRGRDDRGDRPFRGRDDREDRSFRGRDDRRDRPYQGREDRPFRGDDRPQRDGRASSDRDDRAPRSFRDRDDRPQRSFRGEDRPQRSFRSEDRPERADRARRDDRGERTSGDRAERPARFDDRRTADDRPARDRPFRGADERPRREPRDDRREPFRRDDRPSRGSGDRAPRSDRSFRDDRPQRHERRAEDRAPRRDDRAPQRHDDRAGHWEAPEDVVLERLEAEVVTAEEVAGSSFADLGLGSRITEALAELGATEPFPIQSATIPSALEGRNVLGRGRTGSGKTIAFGAALVERLMRNWADSGRSGTGRRMGRPPRALILAPTRELALQIDRTVQPIARAVGLFTTQIVGGVPQGRQVGALSKGVDIVIGTPGRIEDLLEQGRLDLSAIEIAVLDEADHMAELGFLEPMQRLLSRIPAGGQRMFFSATLDAAVAQLVQEFLPDPSVHEVAEPEGAGSADHRVLVIDQGAKLDVLTSLISSAERVLVFARTRAFAEQLADDLDDAGVRAESLHGDLNQARRSRNLQKFSEGRVSTLVATDVAARGIHVDDIDLVIHADAAEDYKTYLHRSGRTGRAGASGTVVTLINPRRRRKMTELLGRAGVEAAFVTIHEGDDPVKALQA